MQERIVEILKDKFISLTIKQNEEIIKEILLIQAFCIVMIRYF